jgi:DNA-binding NtrC family response regulator
MRRKPHAHSGLPKEDTYALLQLKQENPALYRVTIRDALRDEAGSIPRAAVRLKISTSTLRRWIEKDATLSKDIEIAARGWPKGKPRKPHTIPKQGTRT